MPVTRLVVVCRHLIHLILYPIFSNASVSHCAARQASTSAGQPDKGVKRPKEAKSSSNKKLDEDKPECKAAEPSTSTSITVRSKEDVQMVIAQRCAMRLEENQKSLPTINELEKNNFDLLAVLNTDPNLDIIEKFKSSYFPGIDTRRIKFTPKKNMNKETKEVREYINFTFDGGNATFVTGLCRVSWAEVFPIGNMLTYLNRPKGETSKFPVNPDTAKCVIRLDGSSWSKDPRVTNARGVNIQWLRLAESFDQLQRTTLRARLEKSEQTRGVLPEAMQNASPDQSHDAWLDACVSYIIDENNGKYKHKLIGVTSVIDAKTQKRVYNYDNACLEFYCPVFAPTKPDYDVVIDNDKIKRLANLAQNRPRKVRYFSPPRFYDMCTQKYFDLANSHVDRADVVALGFQLREYQQKNEWLKIEPVLRVVMYYRHGSTLPAMLTSNSSLSCPVDDGEGTTGESKMITNTPGALPPSVRYKESEKIEWKIKKLTEFKEKLKTAKPGVTIEDEATGDVLVCSADSDKKELDIENASLMIRQLKETLKKTIEEESRNISNIKLKDFNPMEIDSDRWNAFEKIAKEAAI